LPCFLAFFHHLVSLLYFWSVMTQLLSDLPNGASATVERVFAGHPAVGEANLRRLSELGFIPGEPLKILRRGPGGREPLAVQVGETLFALRWVEAQCVQVLSPSK
jgi:ferrous iron transport protein A